MQNLLLLALLLLAAPAFARGAIPVYGPAHAGVEDADLLEDTVLDIGVLAINPDKPYSLRVGDGVTRGGVEVKAEGTVTNFGDIHVATTNLEMGTWNISYGPWTTSGDYNTFTIARGASPWLRLVREDGEAYMRYSFAILDGFGHDDATHYAFQVAHVEGEPLPVLEVSTNLAAGYVAADTNAIVYSRMDAAHVRMVYEAQPGTDFIFFRMFDMAELSTGAYLSVPLVAEEGITMGTNTWTEWPNVDGKIAAATAPLASTAAVAAVSGRVDAIEADYVVSGDLAPFATTGSVASLAGRVDALEGYHEWPDTCALFWPAGYVQSNTVSGTINLPTNFPTHRLLLVINDEDIESLTINLPHWDPGRCVEIELHPVRLNNTPRSTKIAVNGLTVWDAVPFAAYNAWRYVVMQFDPASGIWQCDAPATFRRAVFFDGTSKLDLPTSSPATVEEWKARLAAP